MKKKTLPRVSIVGRPNVGKSTLFNAIVGWKRAIVGDEEGITRDRIYSEVEFDGRRFEIVDTGGMVPDERDLIVSEILKHARVAIEESDFVIQIVDAKSGLHPLDMEIFRLLKKSGKNFVVAANKVDVPQHEVRVAEFYELGVDKIFPISAEHKRGLYDLFEYVFKFIPNVEFSEDKDSGIKIAVIGKPNSGKSSFINSLLNSERVIVSEIPGTTRDCVDVSVRYKGKEFVFIDTAGIRRMSKVEMKAEKVSVVLAKKHIERADVALLMIDVSRGVTHHDATIASMAVKSGKGLIILGNKYDLFSNKSIDGKKFELNLREKLKFADFAPLQFISALYRKNVFKVFPLIEKVMEERYKRIQTSELNRFFRELIAKRDMEFVSSAGKDVKYITQVGVAPPKFVVFVKNKKKVKASDERFIINQLRKSFKFLGNPIILKIKKS